MHNDDDNKSTLNDNTMNISMNYNHENYSDYTSKQQDKPKTSRQSKVQRRIDVNKKICMKGRRNSQNDSMQ